MYHVLNHLIQSHSFTNFIQPNKLYTSPLFDKYYTYNGNDLGVSYTPHACTFKIWTPLASSVSVNIYTTDFSDSPILILPLSVQKFGIWCLTYCADFKNLYYTYSVKVFGHVYEVLDPYTKAVGANGLRGMIVDLAETNPSNWSADTQINFPCSTDAIIYELHIRDFSIAPSGCIDYPGKYLAFTHLNTENEHGHLSGLSHIKELGITHIHLLPSYDFNSIDETSPSPLFNWGYDPLHYNTPEGSYATNPYDGKVRIKEFKEMVKAIHDVGLGVIMDVVYNHTALTENSFFNRLVPNYYHRCTQDGTFGNASGCGNEIASERTMVRKMIVESVVFWAKEYHIDGFRFDLMGVLDIDTMNAIRDALDLINPQILIYGEGWYASTPLIPKDQLAIKHHAPQLNPRIACFSDDFRDSVKGHVFTAHVPGFINGNSSLINAVKFGIVGATQHPQVNYNDALYSDAPWATQPSQCINYVSAHDNLTLFDKLQLTLPSAPLTHLITINKMAAALVLTSQGIPFIHAGEEFLRSKPLPHGKFDENSYQSSDFVNQLDWSRKTTYLDVFKYYQGLIHLRKAHPAFRLPSTAHIQNHLRFLTTPFEHILAYELVNVPLDSWQHIILIFNPNPNPVTIHLPSNHWGIVTNEKTSGLTPIKWISDAKTVVSSFGLQILVPKNDLLASRF